MELGSAQTSIHSSHWATLSRDSTGDNMSELKTEPANLASFDNTAWNKTSLASRIVRPPVRWIAFAYSTRIVLTRAGVQLSSAARLKRELSRKYLVPAGSIHGPTRAVNLSPGRFIAGEISATAI